MKNMLRFIPCAALAGALILFVACDSGGGGSNLGSGPTVGPKLRGKWSGVYFIDSVPGSLVEITAKVKHTNADVVINTSLKGVGSKLTGTSDESGDLWLTDNFDGETWTTFFGPATENFMEIADFRRDISDSAVAIIRLSR